MQLNTGEVAGSAGNDLNVEPVWMQGITGKGVVVSVFDNGMSCTCTVFVNDCQYIIIVCRT